MTIRCHFDGKVFVPDEPIDLPGNQSLLVHIEPGVVIKEPANGGNGTVGELRKFMGIWKDRTDISDSTEFVQELRRRAQHQEGE
ncbi:MAG TPA: hypothetical protein VHS31_05950 [Tepidisphaeraceae bacterium]|jgi:hypothetical protein|nr:hypothetical protein [Tepidisphaeraceae bacterium]